MYYYECWIMHVRMPGPFSVELSRKVYHHQAETAGQTISSLLWARWDKKRENKKKYLISVFSLSYKLCSLILGIKRSIRRARPILKLYSHLDQKWMMLYPSPSALLEMELMNTSCGGHVCNSSLRLWNVEKNMHQVTIYCSTS